MAKGKSLHIGLNEVDPTHYAGWSGKLNACVFDATDMQNIADSCGFDSSLIINEKAKISTVKSAISEIAQSLGEGDIFLLTYAGHGDRIKDLNGDEEDGFDETWCLFDGQLLDDELHDLWSKFSKGVRIFVVSDSCHSGTIIQLAVHRFGSRVIPYYISKRTFDLNKNYYEPILSNPSGGRGRVQATVRILSACQDNQVADDGEYNGAFTSALLSIWNDGEFEGNYRQFHKAIQQLLPSSQSPNHLVIGSPDYSYNNQKPFTI